MSWQYLSGIEVERGVTDIPDAWVWERLRVHRDRLLTATDWRVVSDAPWDRAPWEAYRQALRDLPANTSDPREAVWPQPPTQ